MAAHRLEQQGDAGSSANEASACRAVDVRVAPRLCHLAVSRPTFGEIAHGGVARIGQSVGIMTRPGRVDK